MLNLLYKTGHTRIFSYQVARAFEVLMGDFPMEAIDVAEYFVRAELHRPNSPGADCATSSVFPRFPLEQLRLWFWTTVLGDLPRSNNHVEGSGFQSAMHGRGVAPLSSWSGPQH